MCIRDSLPTVHEGATVRAMEKKGIRTEKGEFNRWIRATNAVIRDIKKKITSLMGWIADIKAELAKPQAPDLVSLLNACLLYTSIPAVWSGRLAFRCGKGLCHAGGCAAGVR